MQLDPIAKIFVILGILLILIGISWQLGWIQSLKLGNLPGDIRIEKENVRFYFPITTCILISLIFGLVSWLFRK